MIDFTTPRSTWPNYIPNMDRYQLRQPTLGTAEISSGELQYDAYSMLRVLDVCEHPQAVL